MKSIRWVTFIILIIGAGSVFKLSSLKDVFYVPMQDFMHLSNTQIGFALSIYGFVQVIGNFASIYISDRFSKKILIPFSLICIGLVGIYISFFPSYMGILLSWALLALFGEVIYWPVLLKAIRLLGNSSQQGRLFGFLEAGRGVVDTIIAFSALGIFLLLGQGEYALKFGILFYSFIVIVIGIISYFLLEDDKVTSIDNKGNKLSKNTIALKGMLRAIKMPQIWIVSLNIFSIYCIYCGLTYFIPFLKDIYGMPIALIGAYGIINQYALKFIGGPIGGFLADKIFNSSSLFLRYASIASVIFMVILILLPHHNMNVYLGMTLTLGFGVIVFSMRATFFAPIDEIKVPKEISGAAMSIACLLGYSPQLFCFYLYGSIIDYYHSSLFGYRIVFSLMLAFALMGIIVSFFLINSIQNGGINENRT